MKEAVIMRILMLGNSFTYFHDMPQILSHLHSLKIQSLLVEGGAKLLQSFIDASLWDNARVEINRSLAVGEGVSAPVISKVYLAEQKKCGGNDILLFAK
jgi:diaminohydroxyphosphoribosylaminopyrimidine deaminase/5-amino-6-(5-phosphoribosylamino)uracil reductase